MGVLVGDPEPAASASRAVRRVVVRALTSVVVIATMWLVARWQPFYSGVIAGAAIPVVAALLWWTWSAVRRARGDRRARERRRQARRTEPESGPAAGE